MILICTLTGCKKVPYIIDEVSVPVNIIEESADNSFSASPTTIPQKTMYSEIGYTWEIDETNPIIVTGKMELTLQKAWVVDNIDDTPGTGESFYADASFYVRTEDGKVTGVRYPDFILEDGTYVGGGQLVLLEISVHNIDAISEIARVDEYSSPYLFRADSLVQFTYEGFENHSYFFKEAGECEDHPMLFCVDPGEEQTITIGYLLSGSEDGAKRELSLCKVQIPLRPGYIRMVNLNLE